MITKERAQKRLDTAKSDLDQLENRLAISHGLGDTNRATGIETVFQNNPEWARRRDQLRRTVEYYEDYIAYLDGTGPAPRSPVASTLGNYIPL